MVALAGMFLWLLRRAVRMGSQMSNWKGILVGIVTAALIVVFDLLFDYFGFPHSLHEPYGVVRWAILASAAFAASFISRRIVEWKTGPPS
jgi:hypothetical protein